MAIPKKGFVALIALAAGALFLLKPKNSSAATGNNSGTAPGTPSNQQEGSTTVPTSALPSVPGVLPANIPTVTVSNPPATTVSNPAQPVSISVPAIPGVTTQPTTINLPPLTVPQVLPTSSGPATPATPTSTPTTPTVLQQHEQTPAADPNGTIALAANMITAESSPGWKTALQPQIKAWQSMVGLTVDGEFGEKSQLRMGQEVGVLPVIRYYPKGSQQATEVPKQQAALRALAATIANTNAAQGAALMSSAAFEQGEGFAENPPPISAASRLAQANALKLTLGGTAS